MAPVVDIAARLVRLGLQREAVAVALVLAVGAQEVECLAEARQRLARVLGRVALDALAAAPEHIGRRAKLGAQVHGAHGLLEGVGAHAGVVAGEGAVLEGRVKEQVGRRHRHHQAGLAERGLELAYDPGLLGGRGVDRHQVVVVEVDAPGAGLGEQPDGLHRPERRPRGLAKRVAADVADRPKAKGELIVCFRLVHWRSPIQQ
jgi:hypothetical protein